MDDFRHYLTIVQFTSPPVSSSSWHLGKFRGNWRRNQIEFTVKSESFRYLDLPPEIIFKFLVLTNCIDWPGMHYRSFWSRDVIDVLCIVATHTPIKHFRARVTPEQIHLFDLLLCQGPKLATSASLISIGICAYLFIFRVEHETYTQNSNQYVSCLLFALVLTCLCTGLSLENDNEKQLGSSILNFAGGQVLMGLR